MGPPLRSAAKVENVFAEMGKTATLLEAGPNAIERHTRAEALELLSKDISEPVEVASIDWR